MDFVTKSFRKDETLTSWTLLQHICPHFWVWLLNTIAITPKSEDKYVVKVFNSPEFHLSEMTLLQNPYFRRKTHMLCTSSYIIINYGYFLFSVWKKFSLSNRYAINKMLEHWPSHCSGGFVIKEGPRITRF